MCSLISIESGESAEARPREAAASQNTAACIEACRLDELFSDSKFLRAESLIEMVKAMMWAAGPVNRIAASGEDSDTAEVKSCETHSLCRNLQPQGHKAGLISQVAHRKIDETWKI